MENLVIGIVDDDRSKVTQIITHLCSNWQSSTDTKLSKYSDYQLIPEEISLCADMDEVVAEIIEKKVECAIIDYRLSSYGSVGFTGVDLAKRLNSTKHGFPIFLLTAYEDDIYTKEIFDVYQVFNFDRYQNDDQERAELNRKIIEQILKYRKERAAWEAELESLLPHSGESADIDARILELDGYIEGSIDGRTAVTSELKKKLLEGKLDLLISKLDEIIEKG